MLFMLTLNLYIQNRDLKSQLNDSKKVEPPIQSSPKVVTKNQWNYITKTNTQQLIKKQTSPATTTHPPETLKKQNVKIFNLNGKLQPDTVYQDIQCRKSARLAKVQTTL